MIKIKRNFLIFHDSEVIAMIYRTQTDDILPPFDLKMLSFWSLLALRPDLGPSITSMDSSDLQTLFDVVQLRVVKGLIVPYIRRDESTKVPQESHEQNNVFEYLTKLIVPPKNAESFPRLRKSALPEPKMDGTFRGLASAAQQEAIAVCKRRKTGGIDWGLQPPLHYSHTTLSKGLGSALYKKLKGIGWIKVSPISVWLITQNKLIDLEEICIPLYAITDSDLEDLDKVLRAFQNDKVITTSIKATRDFLLEIADAHQEEQDHQ